MANLRVVFLEDVQNVAHGGDVKAVKAGFARNYLIPQKLAIPVSAEALKRVEKLKKQAEATRLKQFNDLKGFASALEGKQINIEMRTGAEGRLYGSVTNAVVAAKLSELVGREIDRRTVEVEDGIRTLGVFSAKVKLHADLEPAVSLVVYPMGGKPEDAIAIMEKARQAAVEAEAAAARKAAEAAAGPKAEAAAPEAAASETIEAAEKPVEKRARKSKAKAAAPEADEPAASDGDSGE